MSIRAPRALVLVAVLAVLSAVLTVAPAYGGQAEAPLSPQFARDIADLDPSDTYDAFIHFSASAAAQARATVEAAGLTVAEEYAAVNVLYAYGRVRDLLSLRTAPGVEYLEANRKLTYLSDTGTWATRARVATEAVAGGPFRTSDGAEIDGSGVGIAIVDSGVAGLHPDLQDHMGGNLKIVCSTPGLISTVTGMCFGPLVYQPVPESDTTSGHGTHVAGIAAGDGTASKETFRGVAPEATLYGYGTGEGLSVLFAAEAFDHIIKNHDQVVPKIKVVNNSWGDPAGTNYDPNSLLAKQTRAMIGLGLTVVYAAGNGNTQGYGGSGNEADDFLSSTAKDPTPGVLTVANYDDGGTGTREGSLSSSSSRGKKGDHASYPDVSAPGTSIASTCRANLPLCDLGPMTQWAPYYNLMGGTSMAAPHIAGAAALLYQANPGLTPAQVEDIIQDTAYKSSFGGAYEADPQNPGGTHSFDKGAGLLDVPAALRAAGLAFDGVAAGGGTLTVLEDAAGDATHGSVDVTKVTATEVSSGIRYGIELADASDTAPLVGTLRLSQNVAGATRTTSVTISSTGVAAGTPNASTNNALATEVALNDNVVSFTVPWGSLGDPEAGTPAHNVYVLSYVGVIADAAPGGTGVTFNTAPEHAAYTIQRAGVPGSIGGGTEPSPTPTPTDASPSPTGEPSPTPSEEPSPTPTQGTGETVFEGEGFIELGHPQSATELEFIASCPSEPFSQGLDGYVFTLPEGELSTFTLTGATEFYYDLDISFWDAGCGYLDAVTTEAFDETGEVPAGSKYAVAYLYDGLETTAKLTVFGPSGTNPSPTPTETATPDPSPSEPATGTRGSYPVTPSDTLFGDQWGLTKIEAPQAWQEANATGHGVVTAIVDSGLDLGHPDFACPGKLLVLPGSDIGDGDSNPNDEKDGHGTHVAGIAGACTDNREGVAGVAPDTTIMPVKVFGKNDSDLDAVMADGIRFATDNGAHVINLSIGDIPPFSHLGPDLFPLTEEALEHARSNGVVIAAAAGNFSQPTCEYPSMSRNVICVVASDRNDLKTWYSDLAVNVDREAEEPALEPVVMAPGGQGTFCDESIVSTYPVELDSTCYSPGYDGLDGTSMSSPHVAGIAALLYDRIGGERSAENADAIVQAILDSAVDLYTPGYDPIAGYGRVDALAAVRAISVTDPSPSPTPTDDPSPSPTDEPSPSPSPTEDPGPTQSSTEFTASRFSGQYSDAVSVEAVLRDEDGSALAGQEVTFTAGEGAGEMVLTATTDEDGLANVLLPLEMTPGSYEVQAAFAGTEDHLGSAGTAPLDVAREDAAASLIADGNGSKRQLHASLYDADDAVRPIGGVVVEFLADGDVIGSATLDEGGTVSWTPPPRYRGGKYTFEVRFGGDDFYRSTSATYTT